MKKRRVILTLAVVLSILLGCSLYYWYNRSWGEDGEGSWGEDGELSLELSLDPTTMAQNQTCLATLTLENTGDEKLRVLFPWYFTPSDLLVIRDENGTEIWCKMQYEPPPDARDTDLTTIRPGDHLQTTVELVASYWELESKHNYTVQGRYHSWDESTVSLPFWRGTIYSDPVNLTIT